MALLNTHKEVETLISAGINKKMAEAILDLHVKTQEELATKNDINSLKEATKTDIAILRSEMNSMKTELKAEISEVKSELKLVESKLDSNINDVKKDVNWIKTISMATFTVLLGTLVTLIIQYLK